MRVVAIVQARFGSARLPGKALRPLAGRPMLDHVLERALCIPHVDQVVLATTDHDRDDPLCDVASARDVLVVRRPDENDVIARFMLAAQGARADHVVRITGDCPLLDPAVSGAVVEDHLRHGGRYTSNVGCGWPDGTDTEIFPRAALEYAHRNARGQHDRQHVTPYLRAMLACRAVPMDAPDNVAGRKWSVDTVEDFVRVRSSAARVSPIGAILDGRYPRS